VNKSLKPDLSIAAIIFLAALAIPRVFVHDLHLASFDSLLYKTLAVGPLVVWLIVAIARKSKKPFYDFLLVGLVFGLLLALAHQINWDASWGNNTPHIGGNLAGKFSPLAEGLTLRTAAIISSVMTGLVFGSAFGLVALIGSKLRRT
jgi:hypothetical protein